MSVQDIEFKIGRRIFNISDRIARIIRDTVDKMKYWEFGKWIVIYDIQAFCQFGTISKGIVSRQFLWSLFQRPSRASVQFTRLMFSGMPSECTRYRVVWNGGKRRKRKEKKLRCIDYDHWPNGCVDLVNSRTSIRYALKILRARSYIFALFLFYEFLVWVQLFYY